MIVYYNKNGIWSLHKKYKQNRESVTDRVENGIFNTLPILKCNWKCDLNPHLSLPFREVKNIAISVHWMNAFRDPFYLHVLTLIPAWISIASILKCGMKSFTHSQTSTVALLKFGNGYIVSSHTLLCMWLLLHAGIEVSQF